MMKTVKVKVRQGITLRYGKGPRFGQFLPTDQWVEMPLSGYVARRIDEGSLIPYQEEPVTPSSFQAENDLADDENENTPYFTGDNIE